MKQRSMFPKTMGQQFGRRSWAEPWKIKMVEPIRMTSVEERQRAMVEPNFRLAKQYYSYDLLSEKLSELIPPPLAA